MQEYEAWIKSDDDPQLLNAPFVSQWITLIDEASAKFGKRFNIAENVEQWFKDAGFEDVRDDKHIVYFSATYYKPFYVNPMNDTDSYWHVVSRSEIKRDWTIPARADV